MGLLALLDILFIADYNYDQISLFGHKFKKKVSVSLPTQSYEERGERILEAAVALITRWGYKKTTIDDIAKQAGVAKGTIYLHWKTREELFKAVILHEEAKLLEDLKQLIANDPEGATLHGMIKYATLATLKRPIWKAIMLRDTDMVGDFAQSEYANQATQKNIENFQVYFETLRAQKLIRTDLTMKQLLYLVNTISIGFLLIDPLLPQEYKMSDEEAVDLLADTIKRTFASRVPTTAEAQQELKQVFNGYLEGTLDLLQEQESKEAEV